MLARAAKQTALGVIVFASIGFTCYMIVWAICDSGVTP